MTPLQTWVAFVLAVAVVIYLANRWLDMLEGPIGPEDGHRDDVWTARRCTLDHAAMAQEQRDKGTTAECPACAVLLGLPASANPRWAMEDDDDVA